MREHSSSASLGQELVLPEWAKPSLEYQARFVGSSCEAFLGTGSRIEDVMRRWLTRDHAEVVGYAACQCYGAARLQRLVQSQNFNDACPCQT
jgi:hypothetical protein